MDMNELEKKLFANELALHNLESMRRLLNRADDDPDYLRTKHNIEVEFEKHKQVYKELTGNDYINQLE